MGETDKQKRIRDLFMRFSNLCDAVPSSAFEVWEDTPKDPPDVCVGKHALGIEFVDFVHGMGTRGSDILASEKILDRITVRASKLFEQRYAVGVWVTLFWLSEIRPKKTQVEQIASVLSDTVYKNYPKNPNETVNVNWDDFSQTCLADVLSSIRIKQLPAPSKHWVSPQAGWIGMDVSSLEMITRGKEAALPRYTASLEAVWLVIVAEGRYISTLADPDSSVKPGCLSSKFDRVYFFDAFEDEIVLLTESKS